MPKAKKSKSPKSDSKRSSKNDKAKAVPETPVVVKGGCVPGGDTFYGRGK